MDFYDLDLSTRKLCTQALLKDKSNLDLLCNYFSSLNTKEQVKFIELSERFYNLVKLGSKHHRITKNALHITSRIKSELNISCYPYIEKIATKGWSTRNGTFSWGIYLLNTYDIDRQLYSFEPVKLFLKKNTILDIGPYNHFTVLGIEDKRED